MDYLTTLGALSWQLLAIEEPHLHISFGSIFLGVFVITVSLKLASFLFGFSSSKGDSK